MSVEQSSGAKQLTIDGEERSVEEWREELSWQVQFLFTAQQQIRGQLAIDTDREDRS